jgi:hypothetical protein
VGYCAVVDLFDLIRMGEEFPQLLGFIDRILEGVERYDGFNGWSDVEEACLEGAGLVKK